VIPELLAKFEEGFDVVQTIRTYDREASFLKRLTSSAFYSVQNALSPIKLQDGAADFRLISSKVLQVFRQHLREHNQFLRGLFQWVGFRSTSIEFVSTARQFGVTKYKLRRLFSFALTGILSFSKLPLRIASLAGFAISGLGLLYGAGVVIYVLSGGPAPPGYPSLLVAVLTVGGLQLIVLGVIGEYLGSIFDEVKHRPLYIVDEVIGAAEPSDVPLKLTHTRGAV
jgi:dolichol-phosphate mannosyltransferase